MNLPPLTDLVQWSRSSRVYSLDGMRVQVPRSVGRNQSLPFLILLHSLVIGDLLLVSCGVMRLTLRFSIGVEEIKETKGIWKRG